MLREPVESTALRSIGYDPDFPALEIEFRVGRIYRYEGVPPQVHQALRASDSKGGFFNREIRGRYPYRRRDERPQDCWPTNHPMSRQPSSNNSDEPAAVRSS